MSRQKKHDGFGVLLGLVAWLVMRHFRGDPNIQVDPVSVLVEVPAYAITALLGSRIPDWIEPPVSPQHRGIFHSFGFLGAVGILLFFLCWIFLDRPPVPSLFVRFTLTNPIGIVPHLVLAFVVGYGSHLLLDKIF